VSFGVTLRRRRVLDMVEDHPTRMLGEVTMPLSFWAANKIEQ
jgi:hypothetical protein